MNILKITAIVDNWIVQPSGETYKILKILVDDESKQAPVQYTRPLAPDYFKCMFDEIWAEMGERIKAKFISQNAPHSTESSQPNS